MSAGDRSSWWSSFAARSTLVFLVLLIAASFGSAWLVDRAARTQVLANAKDDLDHAVDLAEQSAGIGQVNGTVSNLDGMTQQNAALVEESAAAAEHLSDQARALTGIVARFRLAV